MTDKYAEELAVACSMLGKLRAAGAYMLSHDYGHTLYCDPETLAGLSDDELAALNGAHKSVAYLLGPSSCPVPSPGIGRGIEPTKGEWERFCCPD